MKILTHKYLRIRKSPINFGSHPDLDPGVGISEGTFTTVGYGTGNSQYFAQ